MVHVDENATTRTHEAVNVNPYGRQLTAADIAVDGHRKMTGGLWDMVGRLQFEHLAANGLLPNMRLVDVGCGALRGGIHFVGYLEPGNYFGLDLNATLLDAGYDTELARAHVQHRLPRENLIADAEFAVRRFGVIFDMALSHSLFTHLPLNHIRRCIIEVAATLRRGGRFFATFYERPDDHPPLEPYTHSPGGITTFFERNPYHYTRDELEWCARDQPLRVRACGTWGHPRAQRMICWERT